MRHLELGIMVKDIVTGLRGMLTHCQIGTDMSLNYLFQPRGLSPDDGVPVKAMWISGDRIGGDQVDSDIPVEMLGAKATDMATGYSGLITHLTIHISGCVHAIIQAKGTVRTTGAPIEPFDFDIRRLEGPRVPKLNKEEKKQSEKERPSPSPCSMRVPTM